MIAMFPTPTPHISAKPGDFGKTVLMPGDPLRAKFVAEHYLENPVCFNTVRNMLGYTGTYKGVHRCYKGVEIYKARTESASERQAVRSCT